jgi:hypothetical protein
MVGLLRALILYTAQFKRLQKCGCQDAVSYFAWPFLATYIIVPNAVLSRSKIFCLATTRHKRTWPMHK